MTPSAPRFETSMFATPEAIANLTDRVMAFLGEQGVEARAAHHAALVISEFLTNLDIHGNCRDRPAKIALTVDPDQVTGEIIDSGPPFDPRLAADPVLDADLDDRPIGGLGLFLIRQLSCTLEYARRNDENYTRFAINRAQPAQPNAQPRGNQDNGNS